MKNGFFRVIGSSIILHIAIFTPGISLANSGDTYNGVIDEPRPTFVSTHESQQLSDQVKQEQRELASQSRDQLEYKADKGERLAQVVLGADFASEAQLLTFAPIAANDALSDALRWYAIAAQRGFPGAASLDTSGVSFYPVRVVRNN